MRAMSMLLSFAVAVLGLWTMRAEAHGGGSWPQDDYEVWLVDQSNTNGTVYGGTIHIYDGDELTRFHWSTPRPRARIDLGGATSGLCLAMTGANPVRPHMLNFNS